MPRGLTGKDPVVDPVRVWREGVDAQPTLAERLAEDVEPVLAPGQRELTAKEAELFFGAQQHAEEQIEAAAGAPPADIGLPEDPPVSGLSSLGPFDFSRDEQEQFSEELEAAGLGPEQFGAVLPSAEQPATQVCGSGHESPAGAKFCMECGESFQAQAAVPPAEWICGNQHVMAWAAKFCMECGAHRPDLDAPVPVSGAGVLNELAARVAPEADLTPESRAERERLHAAAIRAGRQDPGVVYERPAPNPDNLLFHVLKSGWTFAGQVWFRGQEIELVPGTTRWIEAQRFIRWTDAEQYENYGRICWRLGPWPGKRSYADIEGNAYQKLGPLSKNGQEVRGPDEEQLRQADAMEARRGRGVPRPMFERVRP